MRYLFGPSGRSLAVGVLFVTALAGYAGAVRADDRAGAFRLGADLNVLNLRQFPNDAAFANDDPTVQVGLYNAVGGPEEFLYFAPQFGYLVTDSIVVGAHLGLGVVSFYGSDPGFGIHIVPYFEYLFGDSTGDIRPFVGAQVGPRIFALPDNGGGGNTYVSLVAGGFGGVHIFLDDAFSVSPFAAIDFLYNSSSERAGYEVILGVSLDGWVGGG